MQQHDHSWRNELSQCSQYFTLFSSSLIEERTESSLFLTYFLHLSVEISLLLSLSLTPEETKLNFSFFNLKRIFFPFTEEKMFDSACTNVLPGPCKKSQYLNHKPQSKVRCNLTWIKIPILTSKVKTNAHLVCIIWLHKSKVGVHICLIKSNAK